MTLWNRNILASTSNDLTALYLEIQSCHLYVKFNTGNLKMTVAQKSDEIYTPNAMPKASFSHRFQFSLQLDILFMPARLSAKSYTDNVDVTF